MKEKKSLNDYIRVKEKEASKIIDYVDSLKKIGLPLNVEEFDNGKVCFFSNDFTLASKLKIKNSTNIKDDYTSPYDGGYYTEKKDYFPVFSFSVDIDGKKKLVRLEEKEPQYFYGTERVKGWGDYFHKKSFEEIYRREKEVLKFYKEKGVPNELLINLVQRMREVMK